MQIFKKFDRKKKPNFFHLKIWCTVSVADCTSAILIALWRSLINGMLYVFFQGFLVC